MQAIVRTLPPAAALALLLMLGTSGCGRGKTFDAPPVVRPVKTVTVGGLVTGELTFPATVEAGERAALSFRVSGRMIERRAAEGEEVKKGQLLARLDPTDFRIALEEAKAQFIKAEADYERFQDLFARNAVSLADLQLRRSRRDVTRARLDQAEKTLDYTNLRAPFSGRIGRRYVENFMDVQAQETIFDLNDAKNVLLKFDVPENVLKQVKAGFKVDAFAQFSSAPGIDFPLTFQEISSRADPTTRTFEATFIMPQPDEVVLLPGMTGEVKLVLTVTNEEIAKAMSTIVIPAIAVLGDEAGRGYVWVIDPTDMTVHRRPVSIGPMIGSTDIVVLEGLEGGETIVIAGLTKLQDGMKVRLWEEQESQG